MHGHKRTDSHHKLTHIWKRLYQRSDKLLASRWGTKWWEKKLREWARKIPKSTYTYLLYNWMKKAKERKRQMECEKEKYEAKRTQRFIHLSQFISLTYTDVRMYVHTRIQKNLFFSKLSKIVYRMGEEDAAYLMFSIIKTFLNI